MVRVDVYRTPLGLISAFRVTGHAGAGDFGHDLVCSAISAITQTAVGGLQDYVNAQPKVTQASGNLECSVSLSTLDSRQVAQSQAILETMLLGVANIAESYSRYVSVRDQAVPSELPDNH